MTPRDAPPAPPDRTQLGRLACRVLAALRIYLGVIFLIAVLPKFSGDFAPRLRGFLSNIALTQVTRSTGPF